jgi:KDO2-lipid IV(A) lauroyltransferase
MGAGIVTFRTWSEKKRIVIRFENYYPPKYDIQHGRETSVRLYDQSLKNAAPSESPLVTGIAREVEMWIAEHPEQWSWNYHGNFIG